MPDSWLLHQLEISERGSVIISGGKSVIHSGFHFPYESSWLIYIKLLQWNRFNDFKRLREFLNPDFSRGQRRNSWEYGKDIPLHSLESAMGLDRGALKYSFIDGWFPLPYPYEIKYPNCRSRALVRHCPECIKYGYHSVIFYFERITHCPWHGHALEHCERCMAALDQDWPIKHGIYNAADHCQHLNVVLRIVAPDIWESDFFVDVKKWINDFRDWVQHSVTLIGHTAYEVIVTKNTTIMDRSIAIEYLVQRFGPPGFPHERGKQVSILKYPRSKLASLLLDSSRNMRQRLKIEGLQPKFTEPAMRLIIKSVRRYIFKRYVRHHQKCFNSLKRLSQSDWYRLDAAAICPCVLSYLLVVAKHWGSTPFGFCNAKSSLVVARYLEGKKLGLSGSRSGFEYDVVGILGDFYRHWDTLRNYDRSNFQCMPCVDRFSGRVWSTYSGVYHSGHGLSYEGYWDNYLFMEDPIVLLATGRVSCRKRLVRPLCIGIEELSTPSFEGVENVLCVLYNLASTRSGSCDINV